MSMPDMEKLLDIGIALTKEKDINKLFEIILNAAMDITHCDGGTLYLLKDDTLWFQVMITKSLGLRSGMDQQMIDLPPVPLVRHHVCSRAALDKKLIAVADIYISEDYDFGGAKKYDALTGYQTVSMLAVPMEDDRSDVIGVLQLINAMDEDGTVIPFAPGYERVINSVASQGALCLINRNYAAEVSEMNASRWQIQQLSHDLKHHLQTFQMLAETKQFEELSKRIKALSQEQKLIRPMIDSGNQTLDALLTAKREAAEQKMIEWICDLRIPPNLSVSMIELCAILGNALDNAIEACLRTQHDQNRFIYLDIHTNDTALLFEIKNTLGTQPILRKGRMLSRKTDQKGHGIGMKSMQEYCQKLGGQMSYDYDETVFYLRILIPFRVFVQ